MWNEASEVAASVNDTLLIFMWISGLILAAITVVMIYFAFHYHVSRYPKPGLFKGSLLLEVTWTVIPSVIVIWMFFIGYGDFKQIRGIPSQGLQVNVTGQQWVWDFYYPDWGISSRMLYLPAGKNAIFNITSKDGDVAHSFFLPDFRIKEDAMPGMITKAWIKPRIPGRHNIFCAEFCGKDHAIMVSEAIILSQGDFDKWVQQKLEDRYKPVDLTIALNPGSKEILARNGMTIFKTYCTACHGTSGQGEDLSGARNFQNLENWKKGTKLTDIFRTTSTGIDGTQMRPFDNLPPWDRFALTHVVAGFYKGKDRPVASEEDKAALVRDFQLDKIRKPKPRISIDKAMELLVEEAEDKPASSSVDDTLEY